MSSKGKPIRSPDVCANLACRVSNLVRQMFAASRDFYTFQLRLNKFACEKYAFGWSQKLAEFRSQFFNLS